MNIEITPKKLSGTADAPPSKSAAHRVLICAALSDEKSVVKIGSISEDINATIGCLKVIGNEIEIRDGNVEIMPAKERPKNAVLDCGESGSTLRFMIPVSAALGINAEFTGRGRLPERPVGELLDCLEKHGVKCSREFPIKISGKLKSGKFRIEGNVSSQYITGFLLALPLCDGDSTLEIVGHAESKPYIDLTVEIMKYFGAEINEENRIFSIKSKKYAGKVFEVEGDWSNGAALLACGIEVKNLREDSKQGDKIISEFLKELPAEIDASDIPDLVPVVSVLASAKKGRTVIYNASRLRKKESDRILSVVRMINSLGGCAEETDDGMIICGTGKLAGGTVDSFNDHRIVMAAAAAAQYCDEKVIIKNAEAINKSFPGFFSIYNSHGGSANVV